MPNPTTMDEEFLLMHKSKIQKLYKSDNDEIPVSKITRNHMCPQIGGKTNAEDVRKFLKGLEIHGLGKLTTENDKQVFKLSNKENVSDQKTINLFKQFDL